MFLPLALLAGQMWLGEITRPRPRKLGFEDFLESNAPSEIRPVVYGAGTFEVTPARIWFGDFKQRAVERDSHWTDYIWAGELAFLLDTITVAYRYYIGEAFQLCYGPDTHVERVTINDRIMYAATVGFDNAGSGFLIDDPQAWGGDQPPGEGGQYSWCDITRGNYTDAANAYLESQLSTPPNKTQSLRGISCLISRGPSGFEESGYIAAGGVGYTPRPREWKVACRRQPNNLLTGFHKVGRHANLMEVLYEWTTSFEYGARLPLEYINLASWQQAAEDLHAEGTGWSGKIEGQTTPLDVVKNIQAQGDIVLDPSPSLGLTARLIRRDYSFASLRILNPDVVTSTTRFSPGAYEDTVNKVIVPFKDQNDNFQDKPGIYIDPANQGIQGGRTVPKTIDYLGVGDFDTANELATRDGRALSVPRAPLECTVRPSFGRLTYRGEVLKYQWTSPTFTKLMRVLKITPGNSDNPDWRLEMIEDPFASGFRVSGEPVPGFTDPAAGLLVAPPSATWDIVLNSPDGLKMTLLLLNTNQFSATINGAIIFGSYAPGGQYARIWVTEPGGVQTLSPIRLAPDTDNKAQFNWPANTAGVYEFCVQTFSLRDATNEVKVCADITVAQIGSPSPSPSASLSPSASVSPSISPSSSVSPSSSLSPSASGSHSPSPSSSPSASVSPSASISPSASTSPSSSASPSGTLNESEIVITANAEVESDEQDLLSAFSGSFASGVTGAHGRVYNNITFIGDFDYPGGDEEFISAGCRFQFRADSTDAMVRLRTSASANLVSAQRVAGGTLRVAVTPNATNYDSGSANISLTTWYYATLYARIHDTLGEFIVKLFDASGAFIETLTQTGIDTAAGLAAKTAWGGATGDTYVDHLWTDITGAFRGCGYVETRSPISNGDTNSWTRGGTDTGNNWDQVDELPKNTASYVVATAADQIDLYNFQDRAQAGTIVTAHQIVYAYAAVAGTREWKPICKIGGIVYEGATRSTTNTSNGAPPAIVDWPNNPSTGAIWANDAELDAAQFGVKSVTADIAVQNVQLQVLVDIES